ncbi:MAG: Asp-tRNA(Asn)/Glu-tRNA(Gln) amidotransferase subunit GatB [Peptococcaceae bacterium]|nr:Asp-tRNA(Asn)/Glu-tRNA(Gln) amidotransferase subunit GatB [Peptococcaceae bacterium]
MAESEYQTVIGLEVHAELDTASKIYCGCGTAFGGEENTQVCPVCAGLPGVLPALNRRAVEFCVMAGLALGCEINTYSRQDRKHYFYPDLPKAFQTSQFDLPLCRGGYVDIEAGGQAKRIQLTRIHIEEDAGKLIHGPAGTRVDYNRCGVPLIEIVTEPDFSNAGEVYAFLEALREILLYSGVSNCRMEEGSLRCDINLSIHREGEPLGTRTEMKNLNSFSAAKAAVEYEEKRQRQVLAQGGRITQATLRWDDARGLNYVMRSKEDADEYFYFPEPDIMPIALSAAEIQAIGARLPELPQARRRRYRETLGLSDYDARLLTSAKAFSDLLDEAVALGAPAKLCANFIMGDITRLLGEAGLPPERLPFGGAALAELTALIAQGDLSNSMGSKVVESLFAPACAGQSPKEIVAAKGLSQVSDQAALQAMCRQVIEENPQVAADYRGGKTKAIAALVGQVMKLSRGKANPALVNQILADLLA